MEIEREIKWTGHFANHGESVSFKDVVDCDGLFPGGVHDAFTTGGVQLYDGGVYEKGLSISRCHVMINKGTIKKGLSIAEGCRGHVKHIEVLDVVDGSGVSIVGSEEFRNSFVLSHFDVVGGSSIGVFVDYSGASFYRISVESTETIILGQHSSLEIHPINTTDAPILCSCSDVFAWGLNNEEEVVYSDDSWVYMRNSECLKIKCSESSEFISYDNKYERVEIDGKSSAILRKDECKTLDNSGYSCVYISTCDSIEADGVTRIDGGSVGVVILPSSGSLSFKLVASDTICHSSGKLLSYIGSPVVAASNNLLPHSHNWSKLNEKPKC